MRGIGDSIEELGALPRLDAVLVNPRVPVPADKTARVFRTLAAPALGRERTANLVPRSELADRARLVSFMARNGNDLFAPACEVVPDVVAVTTALERCSGVELVQLCGAGPTCLGIFPDGAAAAGAAAMLAEVHPHWWIAQTTIG
jgi:4-diphosphocytidyl-2-C-methyl-D-erythritol kinase